MEKTDADWIAQLEQAIYDERGWTPEEIGYILQATRYTVDEIELPLLPHTGDQWHFIEVVKQFILSRVVHRLSDDEI